MAYQFKKASNCLITTVTTCTYIIDFFKTIDITCIQNCAFHLDVTMIYLYRIKQFAQSDYFKIVPPVLPFYDDAT